MIRFVNVYQGSLSVAYTTEEKAEENMGKSSKTRVIFITKSGFIKDITKEYNEFKREG